MCCEKYHEKVKMNFRKVLGDSDADINGFEELIEPD